MSTAVESKRRGRSAVLDIASKYTLVAVLLLLIAFFSIAVPESFFTVENLKAILNQQIVVVLLGLAVALPLIVGEFDLSIGYVLGICQTLVIGLMAKSGLPIAAAIAVVLVAGVLVGLFNGLLVVKAKINALIATLGTGSILAGLAVAYSGGTVLFENVPVGFTSIARDELFGIPLPVLYAAVIVLIMTVVLTLLPTGRRMYAIGGNRSAALLAGVNVDRVVIGSFVVSGLLSAIAGVLVASQLGSAQPGLGPQYLLPAFAAAFLGATSIRPGHFNVPGTVIAAYVLAVPVFGLGQMGVASWFQSVFNGLALLIAVGLSGQVQILRASRSRRARLRMVERSREEAAAGRLFGEGSGDRAEVGGNQALEVANDES